MTNQNDSLKTITTVVYGLQAASFIFFITMIPAVIINYVKLDDVDNDLIASHFRWQIRTFWFFMLWVTIGGLLSFVFIGFGIVAAAFVWLLYRIIKGWLRLTENKQMYCS
ncbi:MAG: hypothetical protein OEX83_05330 [Gammaproteobacteria bacterium]|nr:hypothetical protein [Gammaproteobacteria bacterium]